MEQQGIRTQDVRFHRDPRYFIKGSAARWEEHELWSQTAQVQIPVLSTRWSQAGYLAFLGLSFPYL